jgi:hypothetical protein
LSISVVVIFLNKAKDKDGLDRRVASVAITTMMLLDTFANNASLSDFNAFSYKLASIGLHLRVQMGGDHKGVVSLWWSWCLATHASC